jgi:hypothetical protein
MLLLRGNDDGAPEAPEVWSARVDMRASAADVLRALTDTELIAAWAPVSFETEGLSGRTLHAGCHERVSGSITGIRTSFDVEVKRADEQRLELVADGPLSLDVAYSLRQRGATVSVEASVRLGHRRGLTAQLLRTAVAALLRAGALACALGRLEQALALAREPELAAA